MDPYAEHPLNALKGLRLRCDSEMGHHVCDLSNPDIPSPSNVCHILHSLYENLGLWALFTLRIFQRRRPIQSPLPRRRARRDDVSPTYIASFRLHFFHRISPPNTTKYDETWMARQEIGPHCPQNLDATQGKSFISRNSYIGMIVVFSSWCSSSDARFILAEMMQAREFRGLETIEDGSHERRSLTPVGCRHLVPWMPVQVPPNGHVIDHKSR